MHCHAFYPSAGAGWDPFLRLDRVMSLQIGQERDDGRFSCIVAQDTSIVSQDQNSSFATTQQTNGSKNGAPSFSMGFLVDLITKLFFPDHMKINYAAHHIPTGIVGAVVIDTLLDHVPGRRAPGGFKPPQKRRNTAYLSNLAVSPSVRRRGIAAMLLKEAERVAHREWKCRVVTLHVDPSNMPAVDLYKAHGYKFVLRQPGWQAWMERRSMPLALMLKVLPRCHDE